MGRERTVVGRCDWAEKGEGERKGEMSVLLMIWNYNATEEESSQGPPIEENWTAKRMKSEGLSAE